MPDKKSRTTKKSDKKETSKKEKDKVSIEDINKKKEELLKRIDQEIGGDEEEEKKEGGLKNEEKETGEEESAEERRAVDENSEKGDKKDEEGVKSKEESEEPDEKKKEVNPETEPSHFTAAEFGIENGGKKKLSNLILFFIVFLIVALVSAFFYFYNANTLFINQAEKESAEEAVPTETPTPSPEPQLNREEISVQVLNGSGEAGVAGAASDVLDEKGYENVEVGNAENFDYVNVTIQLKEEYEDFFDEMKADLEDDYIVNDTYEVLEDDSEYDVVIIIGTEEESTEE